MSSIVNRVKEAVSSSKKDDPTYTDTTTGSSAQPRTDTTTHGLGSGTTHSTTHPSAGDNYSLGSDNRGVSGPASRTDGPHDSNLMNKADPRVDSDRDYSKNMGANPHGTASTGTGVGTGSHGTHGTSGTHGTTGTHGVTGTHDTTGTHGAGPHSSGLANKADPRVDSDRDGSRNMGANPYGTTGTTHSAAHSAGAPGTASALGTGAGGAFGSTTEHSTAGQYGTHSATGTGPASRTEGPHSSNLGNKADPRVDSDRDGSRTMGSNTHGTSGTRDTAGSHGYGHNTAGVATGAGLGAGVGAAAAGHHSTSHGADSANRGFGGPASKTDGPHESNVANKMDPRVDSDRDHSKNMGANPRGTATTGTSDSTHGTGGGAFFTGGQTGTHGTEHTRTHGAPEGTYGPHESRAANAADPRVDSDRDGSRKVGGATGTHAGSHTGHHGTTGTHIPGTAAATTGAHTGSTGTHTGHTGTHTGTTGTHTGTTGTHAPHTGTTGSHAAGTGAAAGLGGTHGHHTGPAPNTAGPHKSDMLNKLDPRVDSDLDGSKTIGGNKTDDSRDATRKHKDPTDAAQVPPSVLQKHVGGVEVQHDDHTHGRAQRHSTSHQEQHRGL
ncbi:hypothetical protein CDD81_5012 [Ophiocordyceps australis]|uniref:Cell surface protein n=1 Tax=Ophiocordyceps australis TaxID=1399860 RepID=A0A2C5Y616_9HYPO|nr:hypothetical protein CDD81_5012 [Ophiocordyceps australis]